MAEQDTHPLVLEAIALADAATTLHAHTVGTSTIDPYLARRITAHLQRTTALLLNTAKYAETRAQLWAREKLAES